MHELHNLEPTEIASPTFGRRSLLLGAAAGAIAAIAPGAAAEETGDELAFMIDAYRELVLEADEISEIQREICNREDCPARPRILIGAIPSARHKKLYEERFAAREQWFENAGYDKLEQRHNAIVAALMKMEALIAHHPCRCLRDVALKIEFAQSDLCGEPAYGETFVDILGSMSEFAGVVYD